MKKARYTKGEFIVVPNINYFYKISGAEGVFCCICKHADQDGRCYPSYKRIMEVTGIKSPSTVKKHIKTLVDNGFLAVTSGAPKRKVNQYQILIINGGAFVESTTTEIVEGGDDATTTKNEVALLQKLEYTTTKNVEELYPRTISNNYTSKDAVNMGVKICEKLNPAAKSTWYKNKTQRESAAQVFELENKNANYLHWLIDRAVEVHGKEYAPVIDSPWAFINKMEKLRAYLTRNGYVYKKPVGENDTAEEDANELGYSIYD